MSSPYRTAIVAVTVGTIVILTCIPPPAGSEPATPEPPAAIDAPRWTLDSLAVLALSATPTPEAGLTATVFLDHMMQQIYASAPGEAAARIRDQKQEKPVPSGDELVDTARRYSGVRYRWAGMSSRGMDCSGLIARVLKAHDVRAPHSAAELFKLGKRVRFAQLQPGDLLFFKTSPRGISHVGMYIGDDKFIHASSGAGKVVTTSVYDPYYSKRLKGARRLGETQESE